MKMAPGPAQTPSSSPCAILQQGKCPTVGGTDGESHHHQNLLQLPPYMMVNQRNSMSITNTKGLLNMPGQNNCFLNSAVQVLWHLDIFRRSFRELSGHACMAESCIFCALKELFAQFQYSQESALPPDALRRALAETFCDQRRFQLGFMDDAAECFENILMRIHFHIANNESEDMCSARHCIPHQKFAMTLVEQTVCHACGATSEPLPFTQMVHYVPSSALCSQAKLLRGKSDEIPGFGELLRRAGGLGDLRDCPSSCGAVIQIRKTLMNRPEIVSIGLVWDSERPTIEHIMDVFNTIGMTLKLQDVFHSVVDSRWASTATHQLVGIVTYYGKHYSTFFFHTKLRVWIYFDDAAVREIGPKWEQVVEKCCRGHFQPLLLLYANPYGTSVCTSTAPHNVTVVPGHKKVLNGNDGFGINIISDKLRANHYCHLADNQRRAMTPNPEVSCDLHASIQPRRAVTPSGEISLSEDGNKEFHDNNQSCSDCIKPFASRTVSVDSGCSGLKDIFHEGKNQMHNAYNCLAHHRDLWHFQCSENGVEDVNKISGFQDKIHAENYSKKSVPNCIAYKYRFPSDTDIEATKCIDIQNSVSSRPASVDDLLHSSALTKLMGSDCTRLIVQGIPDNTLDGRTISYEDDHVTENAYISRKAVENVLHLQKLQRQKSMNAKHSHVCVSQRNSSSSLESLENMFLFRDKGLSNFLGLKLDIPESANVPRRRDSGNWSGDRNSASSSSTTSLDNPYFYVVGNKRPLCNGRIIGRAGITDSAVFADPGYDSFSLSSSDSYPSIITPGKLDPRLGQILENQQTAFLPYDLSRLQHNLRDSSNGNENHTCGIKDECEKLCIEADIFVAKSVERENVGDIAMAALLSDTAAAKARAAMDAPYSNPHSLSLAKLKHSMCVIRSCNLHKKLKEAEAAQRRKQREMSVNTHHNHQSSHDANNGSFNSPKKKDCPDKGGNFNNEEHNGSSICYKHSENDGYESSGKSIEIYATLPKKSLKKKGGLLSFVESLTGEDNSVDKIPKHKANGNAEENTIDTSMSLQNDSTNLKVSLSSQQKVKACDAVSTKSPGNKKKSRNTTKTVNRDSDLSDYSSEWEHTKKSTLCRTYSGPPTDSKVEFGNLANENLNQTFSGHPTKKQHKIRRKLMGGFMKRKNRSLPDLREGQDRADGASRSFDDCAITETPVSLRKLGHQSPREMKNMHSKSVSQFSSQSLISDNFQNKQTINPGPCQDLKNPVKYTQSFSLMNTTLPQKQAFRTHTPPPYKPPPPINSSSVTDNELLHKKLPSQCEENCKPLATSVQSSTSDTVSKTVSGEHSKKQLPFIRKSIVECSAPPNISMKQSASTSKPIYNNELPKGSAVWLKELQMKQEEIIQKRKLQEERLKLENENSSDSSSTIANLYKNSENNVTSAQVLLEDDGENLLRANSNITGLNHQTSNQSIEMAPLTEGCDHPKSVKDLASKFEKILKPCLQVVDSSQLSLDDSPNFMHGMEESSVSSTVCTSAVSSNLCIESSNEVKSPELLSQRNNSSSHNHEKNEDECIKRPYSSRSTSGCVFNPHLTDGQLTNILRIGTNCAAFRSLNSSVLNAKDSSFPYSSGTRCSDSTTWSETRRPDKPPDYETAIQRLELIRGDRNLAKRVGSNYLANFEATLSLLEQEKKKRGPKKSVTFSDKVVLVACAGDEDNDFLPNPLLERVYKQHLMRKPLVTTDTSGNVHNSFKDNSSSLTQNSTTEICESTNSNTAQTPCHLCHKKTVSAPIVYCPDCAFYMSRFQK